jgi:hypothetical protein
MAIGNPNPVAPAPAPAPVDRPEPGSRTWWLGGEGFRFFLQLFTLLFLLAVLILIVVLFFEGRINLSKITEAQGLIAGVLLVTIVVIEIVAVMIVLFGGSNEPLKDRIQMVRDLLAPLLAIFGTITGFYFGTKAVGKEGTRVEAPANSGPASQPGQSPK